jgi:hypothetical protein
VILIFYPYDFALSNLFSFALVIPSGQSREKPSALRGRFARQMKSNTSARASTASVFDFTWLCPFRTLYHIIPHLQNKNSRHVFAFFSYNIKMPAGIMRRLAEISIII